MGSADSQAQKAQEASSVSRCIHKTPESTPAVPLVSTQGPISALQKGLSFKSNQGKAELHRDKEILHTTHYEVYAVVSTLTDHRGIDPGLNS